MWNQTLSLLERPWIRASAWVVGAILVALVVNLVMTRVVMALAARTKTDIDDRLAAALRRPVFVTLLLVGVLIGSRGLGLAGTGRFVFHGALKTVAVVVWAAAAMRIGNLLVEVVGRHAGRSAIIQPRTIPLFDMLVDVAVIGSAIYFMLLAWNINVTGWLASAGIVGIAVGFAAKDTLANLFAGIFILADAPYKLGDYIILDGNQRGRVTDIGIRSTRILTRDDVEVTIPNAVIANSKIVNETGGPHDKERVAATVEVAYGSDIDRVREVLIACAAGAEHVCPEPEPRVRFREFAESGLKFQLLAWIEEPEYRGRVVDHLNTQIYKGLAAADIEIPFAKRDVYIKEMPQVVSAQAARPAAPPPTAAGTGRAS